MNWHYASGGQPQGPVDDAQLESLIATGAVRADTLVWREGMASWLPLREARPRAGAPGTVPPAGAPPVPGGAGPDSNEVRCGECGGVFPRDNAIQYGAVWVCAACKPRFLQKLREGAPAQAPLQPQAALRYAGFWIRFAARLIDGVILSIVVGVPMMVILLATGMFNLNQPRQPNLLLLQGTSQFIGLLAAVAYNTFFIGKYAATPGKMAVGVKVVRADGSPVDMMRAFGRAWGDRLSAFICYIGFIIAGFDLEKRALHDHMCDTRVVFK